VARYLIETYAPGTSDIAELASKAEAAAQGSLRYVRSIFVPEDEICFHVFEGASPDVIAHAAGRIVEAIEHPA
jgi:hypothetical protein